LNEAVALLKGETVSEDYDTTVDLQIDGFIPASYIKNEYEKLNMYKKISNITCREEMEDIHAELEDRFGEVPSETENLLNVALIRARAHDKFITEISGSKTEFKICMFRNAKIDTYKMHGFLNKNKDTLKFVADSQPYFVYRPLKVPRTLEEMEQTLGAFFDSLDEIMEKEDE
ncbi:MAG: transcription-repair coupling factor, partial [Lachnospiraceae bacterium]|nr:transcription-repair coupling factor [Lachnospiraceae bacterium]